jgi:hypothetical protein
MSVLRLSAERRAAAEEAIERHEKQRRAAPSPRPGAAGELGLTRRAHKKVGPWRRRKGPEIALSVKAVKLVAVVDPGELAGAEVPLNTQDIPIRIAIGEADIGVTIVGELNPRSVRRAVAMIDELGPGNVCCVMEGLLMRQGKFEAAGLRVERKKGRARE